MVEDSDDTKADVERDASLEPSAVSTSASSESAANEEGKQEELLIFSDEVAKSVPIASMQLSIPEEEVKTVYSDEIYIQADSIDNREEMGVATNVHVSRNCVTVSAYITFAK